MIVEVESTCPLNSDIYYDILRRLDGATLASAACSCATFSFISKEEQIWEKVCNSLWASTNREDVKKLLRSIGGFRKFYVDCCPLIVHRDLALDPFLEYTKERVEANYYEEDESITPTDFVSLVDITYKDKSIFSQVLWGISESDHLGRWFYNSPFHIDLGNDNAEKVVISQEGKIWVELQDNLKLSWIIVNRKVNQAANVSSLMALGVQKHWPGDKDCLVRYGSVLPAKHLLPCQVAECILVVKFSMFEDNVSGCVNLELTQVSMQLEDMEGYHVNGRNSLIVLKKALSCKKSKNYTEVLKLCNLCSRVRSEIKEEKRRNESRIDTMCVISGIFVVLTFWFCFLCILL